MWARRIWQRIERHENLIYLGMADPLYLSLWFAKLQLDDALPRALAVMRQFPFSAQQPGVSYIAIQPVSWSEPSILEQRYNPGIPSEQAVLVAADLLHEDYAYLFEASWDLWFASDDGQESTQRPVRVKFIVHGPEFDEGVYEQEGQIKIEFGLDSPFLQEEVDMTAEAESRVRANVKKLVDFTNNLEKNSGANARLLWSESEENFAQKLIARLQKVQ
jgi:hypothetical protein